MSLMLGAGVLIAYLLYIISIESYAIWNNCPEFCYDYRMYDDDEFDEDEDEISAEKDAETERREVAEGTRGIEDRAFYDDLAKKEDDRHNAMRKDKQKRTLLVGEMRQKLRHKDAEVRTLLQKIQVEEDRIIFEQKKAYRKDAKEIVDGVVIERPTPPPGEAIPILTKDIDPKYLDEEFSIERAQAHIKQLKEEKVELEKVVAEMRAKLNEDERALSQIEHQIMRM